MKGEEPISSVTASWAANTFILSSITASGSFIRVYVGEQFQSVSEVYVGQLFQSSLSIFYICFLYNRRLRESDVNASKVISPYMT